MAIILNRFVDVKTKAFDLNHALIMQGGTRFCFDFGFLNTDLKVLIFHLL